VVLVVAGGIFRFYVRDLREEACVNKLATVLHVLAGRRQAIAVV